ncbi:PHP domain-containing protein [bacterium]|nr:PHP domain-containing protein [bacterium]
MKVDLHIHTAYSDGVYTPEKIVELALNEGLDCIAITDHDNILSYKPAVEHAEKLAKETGKTQLEIIQGVEINTIYKDWEVHILGYFPDVNNSDFIALLKNQQAARVEQTKKILQLLLKKENINIKFEDLTKLVMPGGSIGRPHLARAITSAGGTQSTTEAYNKYINKESSVYIERKTVSPHDACEIIYDAGGIPVFAHPYDVDIAEQLTKELMKHGLCGLEAYHRKHSPAMVEYFSTIAENLGLIVTGGSDFHAPNPVNGQIVMGKNFIPDWVYDKLKEEKKRLDMA